MKILAINSGRKKGNTAQVLELMKDYLEKKDGVEVEILHLNDHEVKWCVGCEQCITKDRCGVKDDVESILEKLKKSDGIILSTPVYMGNVCSKLKNVIDRSCRWFHRPPLVGKPSLMIVTTAASGLKDTVNYLRKVLVQWGTAPLGSITKTFRQLPYTLTKEDVEKLDALVAFNKIHHRPHMADLIQYQVQKVLAHKVFDIDKKYWEDQGWSQRSYYYDCRIPFHKSMCTKQFYKFLRNRVKPHI